MDWEKTIRFAEYALGRELSLNEMIELAKT